MFWTVWLRSLAMLSPFWKAAEGIDGPIPQVGDPHGDWEDVPVWRWRIWRVGNGPTRRIPSRRADEVRPPGGGVWLALISDTVKRVFPVRGSEQAECHRFPSQGILCIQFLPNKPRYCIQKGFALEATNKTPAAIGGPSVALPSNPQHRRSVLGP